MSNYKIFVLKGALNEATKYYIGIITEALVRCGHNFEIVNRWRAIGRNDRIIIIDAKTFFMMFLLRPFNIKITWFQGVVPEEAKMVFNSLWREWLWRTFEYFTLKYSDFILFVSNAMHQHYRQFYKYQKDNFLIIPCFNSQVEKSSFYYPGKYEHPAFVYAGNMNKWQCIDITLQVFKIIEEKLPNASLVLLTADIGKANNLLRKHQIRNAKAYFCPLENINSELSKFKYGFILRDDHIVNRVATPTKMSTYLANGVIPVYSDVVDDFKQALKGLENKIALGPEANAAKIAEAILSFEQQKRILPEAIVNDYEQLFDSYFNREKYSTEIALRIDKLESKAL